MDTKRTILWVVFSFSLLMLWDSYNRYTGKAPLFGPAPTTQTAPAAATDANGAPSPAAVPPAATTGAPTTGVPAATASTAAVKNETIVITTDLIKAEIDTAGGEIRHLELLKHHESGHPDKNVVLFDATPPRTYLGQTGLTGGVYPNHKSMFVAQPGPRDLGDGNQVQLVLTSEQHGVKLIKTFTFKRDDYRIDVKHDVVNNTGAPITPSLYLQLVRDGAKLPNESMFYSTFTGPAVYTDTDKFQKVKFDSIEKGKDEHEHATKADSGWIAMVQHYFVSAFVPQTNAQREIYTRKLDANLYAVGTILPMGSVAPGATASMDATLFSGPQESKRLEEVAPGFELVKDYGWLTIIARPIFWLMTHIHALLGNWGWTIIVLTIVIKLAFFPLSAAGYRSMAKMKLVTPKMTDIRTRLKGDPQKMNAAMMELYKKEKINPLGGCFPIVIQIPVFISLYWVLLASVEMRNAPWLWIHDLAAPDTLFGAYQIGSFHLTLGILPILMAVSMFFQTKMNPKPPDPVQAKIMTFMPIAFSIMFFFFPAGLVLYWVVNNILSIAQQWTINRRIGVPKDA